MNLSVMLSLLTSILGFTASIFFICGAVSLTPSNICKLGQAYHGLNEEVVKSLSTQKADFIIGAVVLFLSFLSQVFAIFFQSKKDVPINHSICVFAALVALVFLFVVISFCFSRYMSRRFIEKARNEYSDRSTFSRGE